MTRDETAGWTYYLGTRIVFGCGSLEKLREHADKFSFKKALIVTGKGSMRRTGILERVASQLGKGKAIAFEEVEQNPSIETCEKGAALAAKEKCGLVIGLGGGSALDAAKGISILSANKGLDLRKMIDGKSTPKNRGVPTIMIPTTSGTSSEINKFSVLTDCKTGLKRAIRNDLMIPYIAIIDPELTLSCPQRVTAASGLDALCHAIESHWSTNNNPISRIFTLRSIELAGDFLEKAVNDGKDLEAREKMSLSSLYAGMGFSNTGTTDIHTLSYPITERTGLEHGFACAIALPPFIEFNAAAATTAVGAPAAVATATENNEIIENISKALGTNSGKECAERIREIMKNIGAPTRLSEAGIKKGDLEEIIEEGYSGNKRNNPRKISRQELREILENIF